MSDTPNNDKLNESGTNKTEQPDPKPNLTSMRFEEPSPTPAASQDPVTEPYVAPNDANVKLSASLAHKALNEGITNIGRTSIRLPHKEAQLGGFVLSQEQASTLIGQFPQYKFLVKKGTATPSVQI